jgi:hypothetical protein
MGSLPEPRFELATGKPVPHDLLHPGVGVRELGAVEQCGVGHRDPVLADRALERLVELEGHEVAVHLSHREREVLGDHRLAHLPLVDALPDGVGLVEGREVLALRVRQEAYGERLRLVEVTAHEGQDAVVAGLDHGVDAPEAVDDLVGSCSAPEQDGGLLTFRAQALLQVAVVRDEAELEAAVLPIDRFDLDEPRVDAERPLGQGETRPFAQRLGVARDCLHERHGPFDRSIGAAVRRERVISVRCVETPCLSACNSLPELCFSDFRSTLAGIGENRLESAVETIFPSASFGNDRLRQIDKADPRRSGRRSCVRSSAKQLACRRR